MRLIDADKVIGDLTAMKDIIGYDSILIDAMIDGLKRQPQVDAVEVVRCKDCRYYNDGSSLCTCNFDIMNGENFCSFGERRNNAAD